MNKKIQKQGGERIRKCSGAIYYTKPKRRKI